MSNTFYLVCDETKKKVWIGQGWTEMTTFYSGESSTMESLKKFLNDHLRENLRMTSCHDETILGYEGYGA